MLDPLDATRANEADHRHGAAPTPPPTPARQPRRLFLHPGEMAIVVAPRLGLDGERNSGGRDRQGVDVPPASPRQRVPQPPPFRLKMLERAPDLILRASTHAAAPGERYPVASVEPDPRARTSRTPAAEIAPTPMAASASSPVPALAIAIAAARDSLRYCWRRA